MAGRVRNRVDIISNECFPLDRIAHPLGSDDMATFVAERPSHVPLSLIDYRLPAMPKRAYKSYIPDYVNKREDTGADEETLPMAAESQSYGYPERTYPVYPALFQRCKFCLHPSS